MALFAKETKLRRNFSEGWMYKQTERKRGLKRTTLTEGKVESQMVGKGLRFYSEGFNSCESELGEGR